MMSQWLNKLMAYSHQAKAGRANAKKNKKTKWSKNKRQTTKKIFAFTSIFARCGWALSVDDQAPIIIITHWFLSPAFPGGNLSLVKIWGADHESWLQVLHFFYSLGLLLAHWFLEPFFKNKFHEDLTRTAVKFQDLPNKKFFFIISEVDASESQKHTDIEVQGSLVQSQGFERERVDNIGPSQSQVANFAVDNEFDFASIPTFIIAFAFLILAFYTFMRKREEKVKFAGEEVEKLKEMDEDDKAPGFILVFLSFVLLVFFAAFSWLQLSIGEYLFAYAFHALHFSGKYAKAVSLVYWGTLVLGTLLGIFVIKCLRARTYTGLSLVLLSLSVLPWGFVLRCHGLVWLLASLLGLSTSTIFATVVSWAFQHFGLSGPVGATIMGGPIAGCDVGTGYGGSRAQTLRPRLVSSDHRHRHRRPFLALHHDAFLRHQVWKAPANQACSRHLTRTPEDHERCATEVASWSCLRKVVDWTIYGPVLGSIHTCDLLSVNYCVNFQSTQSLKIGAQPIIEVFSTCKNWPNSKSECAQLVLYNSLLNDKFRQ